MKNVTVNYYIPEGWDTTCMACFSIETGPFALRVDPAVDTSVTVFADTNSTPVVQSFSAVINNGGIVTIHVADTSGETPAIYGADYTYDADTTSIVASNVVGFNNTFNLVTP